MCFSGGGETFKITRWFYVSPFKLWVCEYAIKLEPYNFLVVRGIAIFPPRFFSFKGKKPYMV